MEFYLRCKGNKLLREALKYSFMNCFLIFYLADFADDAYVLVLTQRVPI